MTAPFLMRDRGGYQHVARKPPRCEHCGGYNTAHVAGTTWTCKDCHRYTYDARPWLRGDPIYHQAAERPEEVIMPTGVYDRKTAKKPDPAAVARLMEMRKKQQPQGTVAVALQIVDEVPPDSRGRIGNGGRWMPLRQMLRALQIPEGKTARIAAETSDARDRHRMGAAARAVARERGLRWTIGARIENGQSVLYITQAEAPAEAKAA